jgi:hypothetical protein
MICGLALNVYCVPLIDFCICVCMNDLLIYTVMCLQKFVFVIAWSLWHKKAEHEVEKICRLFRVSPEIKCNSPFWFQFSCCAKCLFTLLCRWMIRLLVRSINITTVRKISKLLTPMTILHNLTLTYNHRWLRLESNFRAYESFFSLSLSLFSPCAHSARCVPRYDAQLNYESLLYFNS